ncbi:MAG TPA: PTS system mannose/fructose/sorbose family transporter subunit IID [Gemmatimonadaceae bacterium]|nr:PTS system mannose/fructose/sorbose family transporter subunit IID [Gemmatimonadaceae bacterium]
MTVPPLPLKTHLSMFVRLLAIQGSWNYETLIGTGTAFCMEPALRFLPGGKEGTAYREALARESQYFNAHPYLAAVAVGALARAELEGDAPHQIERYRRALCSPLGSLGDRLVWASWLPFCSVLALALFAVGAGPGLVVGGFLALYNAGHLWLRIWGLRVGWRDGLRVAPSLGTPILRQGPHAIGRLGAAIGALSLPLVFHRIAGAAESGTAALGIGLVIALVSALVLVRLQGRLAGWKVGLIVLSAVALYSTLRS